MRMTCWSCGEVVAEERGTDGRWVHVTCVKCFLRRLQTLPVSEVAPIAEMTLLFDDDFLDAPLRLDPQAR